MAGRKRPQHLTAEQELSLICDDVEREHAEEMRIRRAIWMLELMLKEGDFRPGTGTDEILKILSDKKKYYLEHRRVAREAVDLNRKTPLGGVRTRGIDDEFCLMTFEEAAKADRVIGYITEALDMVETFKIKQVISSSSNFNRIRRVVEGRLSAMDESCLNNELMWRSMNRK